MNELSLRHIFELSCRTGNEHRSCTHLNQYHLPKSREQLHLASKRNTLEEK